VKNILIIFLSISVISFLQISTFKNDVFSKMKKQDVFISQNERFFNLTDSIIEINKAPFKILYKSQKSQNKSNKSKYKVLISVFKENIKKNKFKLGTTITNYCHYNSWATLAQGPHTSYLGISKKDWCYKTKDEFRIPFCHLDAAHQSFYYFDEEYNNMTLRNSNNEILNLEYTIDTFIDKETGTSSLISNTLLDSIYIVSLQDFNFNNIIDEGELTICLLKLSSN
jgi:hypothetical protein